MTQGPATERAVAALLDLSKQAGGSTDLTATAELLRREIPRSELVWKTHTTTAPGIGEILIAGPECAKLATGELSALGVLAVTAHRGFYAAAADGREYASDTEVASAFGATVAANYPTASPAFVRFATTYWSLYVVKRNAEEFETRDSVASQVLEWIDAMIVPRFFPHGPSVSAKRRERDQRRFLEANAPLRMDIDGFLSGSPVLAADRQAGRGCRGAAVLTIVALSTAVAAAVHFL
jgi:hypothetical protein